MVSGSVVVFVVVSFVAVCGVSLLCAASGLTGDAEVSLDCLVLVVDDSSVEGAGGEA